MHAEMSQVEWAAHRKRKQKKQWRTSESLCFHPFPRWRVCEENMVWTCIWDGMSKMLCPCVCVSAWFRMAWVTWWWWCWSPEDAWVAFFRTEEMAAAVAGSQSRIRRDLGKNKKKSRPVDILFSRRQTTSKGGSECTVQHSHKYFLI